MMFYTCTISNQHFNGQIHLSHDIFHFDKNNNYLVELSVPLHYQRLNLLQKQINNSIDKRFQKKKNNRN